MKEDEIRGGENAKKKEKERRRKRKLKGKNLKCVNTYIHTGCTSSKYWHKGGSIVFGGGTVNFSGQNIGLCVELCY